MEFPKDIATYTRKIQEQRLYQLLLAVDDRFADTKKEILKQDPRSTVETAYNELHRLGVQSEVHTPLDQQSSFGVGQGLVMKPSTDHRKNRRTVENPRSGMPSQHGNEDRAHLECSYCKKKGHSRDKSFQLHGYSNWWEDFKKKTTDQSRRLPLKVAQSTGSSLGAKIPAE